jgi:ribonuclease J
MLRGDIPLVASPESIVIMKGMQDCGVTSLETDTAYFSPRQPKDEMGLYLSSVAGMSYQGRDFCSTKKPSEALAAFLSQKPGQEGKRAKKLEPGRCCCLQEAGLSLPFEVSAHPVDHSIPGAAAYILRGETTVAYTGDFRLHGKNEISTREFIGQAREASVLITEGTRAGPSEEEKTSERSVCEACREGVEDSTGLVIADFSPRNFERLESFQEIAKKSGRQLVVMAKDMFMLHCLQSVCGWSRTDGLGIYSEIADRSRQKWEQEVVAIHYGDRYVDHAAIRDSPQDYILCFSFLDMKHLLDIKPEGGTYIYSACEAFNEEMEIDFYRLWQWLRRFGISSRGFSMNGKGELSFERRYHASGHAPGEDIAWAIEQIDPDVIVPVHTEAEKWFSESFDNVMAVEEGVRYEF